MAKQYPVTHTEAERRKILTPEQYEIMCEHGTEAPGSCALLSATVRFQAEVRKRHRLAELQRRAVGRGRNRRG